MPLYCACFSGSASHSQAEDGCSRVTGGVSESCAGGKTGASMSRRPPAGAVSGIKQVARSFSIPGPN